jgi:hypothetical protein
MISNIRASFLHPEGRFALPRNIPLRANPGRGWRHTGRAVNWRCNGMSGRHQCFISYLAKLVQTNVYISLIAH